MRGRDLAQPMDQTYINELFRLNFKSLRELNLHPQIAHLGVSVRQHHNSILKVTFAMNWLTAHRAYITDNRHRNFNKLLICMSFYTSV